MYICSRNYLDKIVHLYVLYAYLEFGVFKLSRTLNLLVQILRELLLRDGYDLASRSSKMEIISCKRQAHKYHRSSIISSYA